MRPYYINKEGLFPKKPMIPVDLDWMECVWVCGCMQYRCTTSVCVCDMLRNVNVIWDRRNTMLSVSVLIKPHVVILS